MPNLVIALRGASLLIPVGPDWTGSVDVPVFDGRIIKTPAPGAPRCPTCGSENLAEVMLTVGAASLDAPDQPTSKLVATLDGQSVTIRVPTHLTGKVAVAAVQGRLARSRFKVSELVRICTACSARGR